MAQLSAIAPSPRPVTTKPAPNYIPGLDGLRALAIIAVLFAHGFEQFGDLSKFPPAQRLLYILSGHLGTAGVKLFFAISGYLICSRLAEELSHFQAKSVLKAFYIRRFFRIIPPLVPYLLVLSVGAWLGSLPVKSGEILAASFFSANYYNPKSWYTAHFWSLAVEEHFYILWAPLLGLCGAAISKVIAIGVIVLTVVLRPLAIMGLSGAALSRVLEQTHLQLDSFMFPCLLVLLLRSVKWRLRITAMVSHVFLAILALVLGSLVLSQRISHLRIDTHVIQTICFTLLAICPTLKPDLGITRLLENPCLTWIGRRSYGIYIWQQLFLVPASSLLGSKVVWFFIHSGMAVLVAGASYKFLETPLVRKGRALAASVRRQESHSSSISAQ